MFYPGKKELTINKKEILFVILAGGLSSRFEGGLKTFAKINGKTLIQIIINFLKKQNVEVIINTNFEEKLFKKNNLPIIKDIKLGFQGPLAGIHSAMFWANKKKKYKKWIFAIPCDTPFLPENLIDRFVTNKNKKAEVLIARSNGKIHPTVSMWNVNLLNKLEDELSNNNRKIMEFVKKNHFNFIDFKFNNLDPFFNINTKSDLEIFKNQIKINLNN